MLVPSEVLEVMELIQRLDGLWDVCLTVVTVTTTSIWHSYDYINEGITVSNRAYVDYHRISLETDGKVVILDYVVITIRHQHIVCRGQCTAHSLPQLWRFTRAWISSGTTSLQYKHLSFPVVPPVRCSLYGGLEHLWTGVTGLDPTSFAIPHPFPLSKI